MASLSGPGDFIVNLLVLLLLLVAVVLLADRLLKNRSGTRHRKPRKGRKRKRGTGERPRRGGTTANSARLTRNYFTSSAQKVLTPQEQEFGALYEEVNKALNDDPQRTAGPDAHEEDGRAVHPDAVFLHGRARTGVPACTWSTTTFG